MEKKTFSEKFDAFMMKDTTFILLVMGACGSDFRRDIYVYYSGDRRL